jgi:hypothetical protein
MTHPTDYVPPRIWTWNKPSGGAFASINRPVAGPTHDRALPVGRHPLQLYSLASAIPAPSTTPGWSISATARNSAAASWR